MSNRNDVLLRYLSEYCDVNALGPDWQGLLKQTLETTKDRTSSLEFKKQLKASIVDHQLTLLEFERATGWGLDTEAELIQWLIELWGKLYEDDPFD